MDGTGFAVIAMSELGITQRLFTRTSEAIIDSILPPQCLSCRAAIDRHAHLCSDCWSELEFITDPVCGACGRPLYSSARAVVRYNDRARDIILGFKHSDRTERANPLAEWMARAGAEVLNGADCLVPVPLHRRRLWARKYNQAAMLALAISKVADIPVIPDALVRVRRTAPQGGLGRVERRRNVAGAFSVGATRSPALQDQRIVLIDDVLTSGATAEACSSALLAAGAAEVGVLTFAHVLSPKGAD